MSEIFNINMPYKEKEIKKVYYSIGEVAELFEVAPSLIRYWETEFSILSPRKGKSGNRMFTQKDIDNLGLIYHLVKEKGYTLEGAKKKLKENKEDAINVYEVTQSLKKIKSFLEDVKKGLN